MARISGDDYSLKTVSVTHKPTTNYDLIPGGPDLVLLGTQFVMDANGGPFMIAVTLAGITPAGTIVWQSSTRSVGPMGSPKDDNWDFSPAAVAGTTDGYMVVGTLQHRLAAEVHLALARFDSTGNCLWLRTYDSLTGEHAQGVDIVCLGDPSKPPSSENPHDLLVVGNAPTRKMIKAVPPETQGEAWIFRVNPDGNPQPGFRSIGLGLAFPYRLRRFGDTILLVGATFPVELFGTGPASGWLQTLDFNGKPLTNRSFLPGEQVSEMPLRDIAVGTNSWITISEGYLISLNPLGGVLWAKKFQQMDFRSIDSLEFIAEPVVARFGKADPVLKFSQFVTAGYYLRPYQAWLALFDESGNPVWQKYYSHPGPDSSSLFGRTRWLTSTAIGACGGANFGVPDRYGIVVRSKTQFEGPFCSVDGSVQINDAVIQESGCDPDSDELTVTPADFTFITDDPFQAEDNCYADQ